MKIRLALLVALILSAVPVGPSFAAGERYALVIGNAKYPDANDGPTDTAENIKATSNARRIFILKEVQITATQPK